MSKNWTTGVYSHMPHKWYVHDIYKTGLAEHILMYSSQQFESLHIWHYIHHNINPSHFMVRFDNAAPTIYLIDFSLARQFRDPATYLHTPYTTKHSIIGTLMFTSINSQQGHTQSRRDDLESLAYTIIFLVCGHLPWTTVFTGRDHWYKAVLEKKMMITAEELCEGLPPPFLEFIIYIRS